MKFYINIYIKKNYLMYFINSLWESILLKHLAGIFRLKGYKTHYLTND